MHYPGQTLQNVNVAWFLGHISSLLWLLSRPHDARDADDAGSWGAAGCVRGAVNPNKTLKMHAVGNVCGSMTFLMALLRLLTPPCLNQAKMGSQLC